MGLYFTIREKVRFIPWVQRLIYTVEGLKYARGGALSQQIERRSKLVPGPGKGVALFTRIKDEAPVLEEWIEYYRVAGVSHFFFYESFSSDNFREVLRPYIEEGLVTLIADWPCVPVTPYAEEDCVLRALNRFEWLGFLDVDEFLVIKDGSSIGDFLARYGDAPAVAMHWVFFGTSGHKTRPTGNAIRSYTRRDAEPDRHVKIFLRPEGVTHCRNPHSWQYKNMRHAISEAGYPVYGSFSMTPQVKNAFVGHFHCKSEDDYLSKLKKMEACDAVAMKFQRRSEEAMRNNMERWNRVEDFSVQTYYRHRCEAMHVSPVLLDQ